MDRRVDRANPRWTAADDPRRTNSVEVKGVPIPSVPPFISNLNRDGQHRLWAFDDALGQNFELPVVAFAGLDIGCLPLLDDQH